MKRVGSALCSLAAALIGLAIAFLEVIHILASGARAFCDGLAEQISPEFAHPEARTRSEACGHRVAAKIASEARRFGAQPEQLRILPVEETTGRRGRWGH